MIVFRLLADGGFVAGDTATGRTSYAYPTSEHANIARRLPDRVAREMMKAANAFVGCDTADYDARMWRKLPVQAGHEFNKLFAGIVCNPVDYGDARDIANLIGFASRV